MKSIHLSVLRPGRYILVAFLLGFIPVSFSECSRCKCEDPGPARYYSLDSLSVRLLHPGMFENGRTVPLDSTKFFPFDSVTEAVSILKATLLAHRKPAPCGSLTTSAYACDCAVADMRMRDHVTQIEIISTIDVSYTGQL